MKTLKPTLLLMAIFFLLLSSMKCKKDRTEPEPQLPAATQTGAQTFGCLVDGKVFVPYSSSYVPALTASIQFDILNFSVRNGSENIILIINNFSATRNRLLTSNSNVEYSTKGVVYKCESGVLEITKYDNNSKILSGRLDFTAKNLQTGKVVSITDGRFDVKYSD